jgi:hypothetical protein
MKFTLTPILSSLALCSFASYGGSDRAFDSELINVKNSCLSHALV